PPPPPVGAALRLLSVWAELLSQQEWESLTLHAQMALPSYGEYAEDLVQSVLSDVLAGRFDSGKVPRTAVLPLLKSIIKKRTWNLARSRRRHERRERHPDLREARAPGANMAFRTAALIRLRADLARALAALPKAQRRTIVLINMRGWTVREVAELEGVSEAGVRQRLARAKAKLRMLLMHRKALEALIEPWPLVVP
ncbi:MAG: sigma-70 family RNA polymerase sigma factor, partial [Gemmatimonadota bacterium]